MSTSNPYWYKLTDERRRGVIACLRGLGLSLSDIAKAAGVNPSTVHAWLARRAASQADKLERLYSAMPDTAERCLPEPPVGELDVDRALGAIASPPDKGTEGQSHRGVV
jgi:AcrR family transcriptional regulator